MIRRFYQISSDPSQRSGGSDSDFSANIVLPEMSADEKAGLCVVVTKASIPKTYDNVVPGRNTFTLRENATDILITVPVATYSALDFKTTLQGLLNAATVNAYTYAVTFNQQTGRYRITSTGNSSLIMPASVGFGIHTLIGLAGASTNAMPITSTNKVNYQLTAALQLRSDMVSANDNVLTPINAEETAYAASIVYQGTDLDTLAKPLAQKSSGTYRFYITTSVGQAVELNGGTVSFELLIYTPLAYLIKQYLALRTAEIAKPSEPDEKAVMALASKLRADANANMIGDTKTAAAPVTMDAVVGPTAMVPPVTSIEEPSLIEDYAEISPDMDGDIVVVRGSRN